MEADEPYEDDDFEQEEEDIENVEDEEVDSAEVQWKKILDKHHPECRVDYIEDVINKLTIKTITPEAWGIGEEGHKSPPFLTIYEKTSVIALRSRQIANGATPYVPVPSHVTNVEEIARMELEQRRLPFIVKRPMPDGSFEFWRIADLMIL
jgi:DNA-directed RNA polymerase I, II, and III subunit RPABC2